MISMVDYVKQRVSTYNIDVAVDATLGNGNDTLYLQDIAQTVYSFDIQEVAINNLKDTVKDNVHLILDSHANVDQYVDSFDVGVFNLGYLPGQDHIITTKVDSTSIAIKKCVKMMNKALFIVVYIGHEDGKKESEWIDEYVSSLDSSYNVSCFKMMNKKESPYVIEIEKRDTSARR